LAYCRRFQTDGVIPFRIMRDLYSFTKSREKQLASPAREGLAPLWELVPGTGYKVHNYLAWNPSKDEENERRAESKDRMRVMRERRKTPGVPPLLQRNSDGGYAVTPPSQPSVTTRDVLERDREKGSVLERESERKPAAPSL